MKLKPIVHKASKFIGKHLPDILTGGAILGTIVTSYFVYDATVKSIHIIQEKPEATAMDILKPYGRAAASMGLTIACTFGANRTASKQIASLQTNYNNLLSDYSQYRAAAVGAFGAKAHTRIMDEKVRMERAQKPTLPTDDFKDGEYEFYDPITKQSFKSTLRDVMEAENDINHLLSSEWYVNLDDYRQAFGLADTYVDSMGQVLPCSKSDLGWDGGELLDWCGDTWLHFDNVRMEDPDGYVWYRINVDVLPTIDGIMDCDIPPAIVGYDEYGIARTTAPWMKGGDSYDD